MHYIIAHHLLSAAKPILNHDQPLSWVTHPAYILGMDLYGMGYPSGHAPSQLFLHFLHGRA